MPAPTTAPDDVTLRIRRATKSHGQGEEIVVVSPTDLRVGDVIDPTDISLYRQLAGGVTTANLLHGSANAIPGEAAAQYAGQRMA